MVYSTLRLLLCALLLPGLPVKLAQARPVASAPTAKTLEFVENRGQWDVRARYMAELPAGRLFLEKTGFTYTFADPKALNAHKNHTAPESGPVAETVRAHTYRVTFEGGSAAPSLTPGEPTAGIRNYFLGNDAKRWAAGVRGFREVSYANVYPGIGARLYENAGGNLEYDFTVRPGGKPAAIRLRYTGAERLSLENGHLLIQTSVGTVTEQAPRAWQELNGQRVPVECAFVLEKNIVSFRLGTYNSRQPLLIDPTVIFSSFTGSSTDNWGFTATYDEQGNMYSGGIVFGLGYPASNGAYDQTYAGAVDIGIIKYNTTVRGAAARLYATYLGGSLIDVPHSLVVNSQNELVILGSTGSSNFPISGNAFDTSFNGGPREDPLNSNDAGLLYSRGTDLVVTKLNGTGTTLLASTYLGGTGTDGIISSGTGLVQNYGDSFRGDVITDPAGNVYIASTTSSTNFPARNGFRNTTYGGTSDAVVVKFTPNLNVVTWASYLGGTGADAAYSIQLDEDRNVYVSGGTTSANLPSTTGRYQAQQQGGIDGFIARISTNGDALTHATYIGTPAADQAYFLQLDALANVYVLGQTRGNFPRTAGLYGVANGRQFIQKLDNTLTTSLYSTVFGAGRAIPDLSLTAFLVDDCERIYISGWGGSNGTGNTRDLPTTADAVQRTTDGLDFYIAQFRPGMTAIEYASFYGQNNSLSGEHVDGGTSRFDKRGAIYQAVCGGCGGSSGFPVPPGANFYTASNNSTNCNNAAFKIDFAAVVVDPGPNQVVCYNTGPQRLAGSPAGGVWSGPGVTALPGGGYQFTPSVNLVGRNTLTYTVNTTGVCQSTKLLRMTVTPERAITFTPPASVCTNTSALALTATPAGGTFSGPGVTGRSFNPSTAGVGTHILTYTLADTTGCGTLSRTIVVENQPTVVAGPDTTLCSDQTRAFRLLRASPAGGVWTGTGVTADGLFTPPNTNNRGGVFNLEYTITSGACKVVSTRKVTVAPTSATNVSLDVPECQAAPEFTGLAPFTVQFAPILAGGTFRWDFGDGTISTEEAPVHVYENPGTYTVQLTARYAGCTVVTQFAAVRVGMPRIPNIFTPNNDNLNETFAPRISCLPTSLTMFTRWGNKVYETANYQNDWRGGQLPDGVYYYLLRDAEGKATKGWVEIKR